jgi:hypothetical protein
VSLLLIGERERESYQKILFTLGRVDDVATFPVNANYFHAVRERVKLARRIDKVAGMDGEMDVPWGDGRRIFPPQSCFSLDFDFLLKET